MVPADTKQWLLVSRPSDLPAYQGANANFRLETTPLASPGADQVVVKTLYLSNDPAQRAWLNDIKRLYVPPVPLNTPMRARGIAEVVESRSPTLQVGDKVTCTPNWSEYAVLDAKDCVKVEPPPQGLNYSHYIGALGSTGLTAYFGLVDVGEARAGQTLVVSGAAGATGNMVVQIAKGIVGCSRVIGIAGTEDKCRWVESLGAGQ